MLLILVGRGPAVAATPAGGDPPLAAVDAPVPQENVFASVRQAVNEDFDHEVVRGHFDVGVPPDARRYYCLVGEKKGKRQPNGVSGQPVARADGMTGIKANAVSAYDCASAEQKGILITTGYVLSGKAAAVAPAAAADVPGGTDVGGVKIGMSLDQVRAVLKTKKLQDYFEATETLGQSTTAGRFVNRVAVWNPPVAVDSPGAAWDSYEVMFTPVPGKERALAIIHSVAFAPAGAVRERVLKDALVKKYGSATGASDLPLAPTWTIQTSGGVQVGDSCNRRAVIGGLGPVFAANVARRNLALTTTLDELQYQLDRCGVTIVTEDHMTATAGSPGDDRDVARYTVTAYSPSLALEGARSAAQLLQNTGDGGDRGGGPASVKGASVPTL